MWYAPSKWRRSVAAAASADDVLQTDYDVLQTDYDVLQTDYDVLQTD